MNRTDRGRGLQPDRRRVLPEAEREGWRIEDGESRMVRSLRSLDGESRIVHRESWGRGDTRLGSGKRSAPPLAPPRRFLISPSSRLSVSPFPHLLRSRPRRLFPSSIHRHPPTTRPPSHRHEHPLHPGTTNPLHPLFLSFSLWRRDARTGASTLVSAPHPHSPRLAGDLAAVLDLVHRQIDTEAHRAFIDRLG